MKTRVLLIHDGAVDEFMSSLLLATMDDIELVGVVIVAADCLGDTALQVQWKLHNFTGCLDVPATLSGARGLNPFPWPYRVDCVAQGQVPALDRYGPNPAWPPFPDGDQFLREFFTTLTGRVTVLCLSPITPLTDLLRAMPTAAAKIERLVWMAGAIAVSGNLDPSTLPVTVANPYAEWNVFWDPPAVDFLLRHTTIPITLFPLDVSNKAKVTAEFMNQLLVDGRQYPYANLARQSYALVGNEPFYRLWDTTTTAWLARPDLFQPPRSMKLSVVLRSGSAGALVASEDGREVDVVMDFSNMPGFYDYLGQQFRH